MESRASKKPLPRRRASGLGGTAIVPPSGQGRSAASLRRHYPDQVRGVYSSQCALRARTPPANSVNITWRGECQKTDRTAIIPVLSNGYHQAYPDIESQGRFQSSMEIVSGPSV